MKSPELLKNLPTPVQIVWRPVLLISLVLHGIVLILPVPSTWETSEPEEQVKVTQLPSLSTSPESSVNSAEEPKAETSPTPNQPNSFVSAFSNQPTINSFPDPIQPTSDLSPRIEFSPGILENPQSSPSLSSSSSKDETQTIEEKNTNTTDQTINSGIDTNDDNVEDPLKKFLTNFPFPEEAAIGSLGILTGEADTSARHIQQPLGQVIKYYGKELPERNYTLANPSIDEPDFKVYQVSQEDVSQYLHLVLKGENTIIFLSETQLDRADLTELGAETAEERELKETVEQIIIAGKYEKELSEGVKKKLGDGKYNHLGTVYEKATEQLGDQIESKIKEKGFKVPQVFPLGEEGIIYSVEKNDFKGFIQLIPTQDESGTAVISLDDFSF
ncbi:MAG: hypothetical protein RID53_28745 [Coleofasciculus sp. B1-GNL1-01]|uniref:hypothetical protein n=1 Tax=Coleofasciculus sp. B1-GNL1-01 TaxID=3068484 RepID=UPI0032FDAD9C